MKNDFIKQYEHSWRVLAGLVNDFDPVDWLTTGRGAITPARLALHILQSSRFYMQDTSVMLFASGKGLECRWESVAEADLPSQTDVLDCIEEMKAKTTRWLTEMEFNRENTAFPWAGETKMGVALFTLRHSLYHTGELSSLLNESKNGDVQDNYVKALQGM